MTYRHKKTGNLYETDMTVINATNAQDKQVMVLYHNDRGMYFVREEREFFNKFEPTDKNDFVVDLTRKVIDDLSKQLDGAIR